MISPQQPTRHTRETVEGFAVHTLANGHLTCSIVPELGARVVSLRDLTTGREWLDGWSPESARRLWRPTDPSDYATGPGAGLDECLPTVLPCAVDGRQLNDHGELWNRAVEVQVQPGSDTVLSQWTLETLPLAFARSIRVVERRIHFDYRLENLATAATPFQWAWHPLFTFEAGDVLEIDGAPKHCLEPGGSTQRPWPTAFPGCDLARADLDGAPSHCAKVFLGPLETAAVTIRSMTGAGLELSWEPRWLPYAGIWITRGGWRGLHHWAVEPTNAPVDRASEAAADDRWKQLVWLAPREVRHWQIIASVAGC